MSQRLKFSDKQNLASAAAVAKADKFIQVAARLTKTSLGAFRGTRDANR
jgi:hypothetical protein